MKELYYLERTMWTKRSSCLIELIKFYYSFKLFHHHMMHNNSINQKIYSLAIRIYCMAFLIIWDVCILNFSFRGKKKAVWYTVMSIIFKSIILLLCVVCCITLGRLFIEDLFIKYWHSVESTSIKMEGHYPQDNII